MRVNNVPVRIVGVAPAGFFGLRIGGWTDLYASIAARGSISVANRAAGEDNQQWWVRMAARMRPGADAAASVQQLSSLYQRLVVPSGMRIEAARIPTLVADPGRRGSDPAGQDSARRLWILLLLSGLVLLIVCANIANLLLARSMGRQRESAMRRAIGATRLRVLRQQLVESLLLAAIGGLLGLGVGYALTRAGESLAQDAIGQINVQFDLRVVSFTAGIALLTALLFGLAPGLRAARSDWGQSLKSHSRSVFAGRLRLPRLLAVIQLALCIIVIAAAGLLVRTLANLRSVDIGFDRANIVYASVNPWQAGYQPEGVGAYVDRLRRELSGQPGVLAVATAGNRPLSGAGSWTAVGFPGRPSAADGSNEVMINEVSDGLFETLGVPLLAGRSFAAGDMRPGADAAVVNEAFVQAFFPNQNPLGQRFGTGDDSIDTQAQQIVGVVGNSSYNSLREEVRPTIYRPLLAGAMPGAATNLVIRAAVDSSQLAILLRSSAAAIDASVPLDEIQTQTALADRLLRNERLLSTLSAAFGTLALGLAAVGLGGLLAYAVARRRNEIGVRMALGDAPGDVARMVLGDTLRLVAFGAVIGLPGAYGIGRLLEGSLYGLQPADPATAAAALAVLGSVAALAAWLPARRAARIDPVRALREE